MGFSLKNISRSTYLRFGLPGIIYFLPALLVQYLIDMDTVKGDRLSLPPLLVHTFTIYHQLLLTLPTIPFRFPYPIDLLLTMLEMASCMIIWCLSYSPDPAFLSLVVFDLVLFCVLFLIGCLKLGDVINSSSESGSRGLRAFCAKYDYLTARPWSKEDSKRAKKALKARPKIKDFATVLMVAFSLYFIIGSAWSTIIIAPVRETASIPRRTSKSLHHPFGKLKTDPVSDSVWSVIVGRPAPVVGFDLKNDSLSLASAVEVVLLPTNGSGDSNLRTPCPLTPWQSTDLPQKDLFTNTPMTLSAIAFKCPYKADLLVTVNFTKLGKSLDGGINSVVQVMLGNVTDSPTEVIRRTEVPALLIPGVNFVGFAKMHILQKFRRPKLSTLGLFSSYETFLVSDIVNLSPDPQALALSPTPDLQVATIRIIPLIDLADWRIIQEYRDRSVLNGFSVVGGLWTFLGGVFAFLFGKSISFFLFRIKPLSIFGLVDQFHKDSIGKDYRDRYKGIDKDAEGGFNKFVADHFVALDLVKETTSIGGDAATASTSDKGQPEAAGTPSMSGSPATVFQSPVVSAVASKPEGITPTLLEAGTQTQQPEAQAVGPGTATGTATTRSSHGSPPTQVDMPTSPGFSSQAQPAAAITGVQSAPPGVAAASAVSGLALAPGPGQHGTDQIT